MITIIMKRVKECELSIKKGISLITSGSLATGHNSRIASVAALEGDAQYFIIWNISDHCLNFSINMIRFEKVGG